MNDTARSIRSEVANAVLGQGTEFEGKLSFQGTVRIDGKFSGEIRAQNGTLIIGQEAVVKANVFVEVLKLEGTMEGNVTAQDTVELKSTGKLTGDITTKTLSVEKGAKFNGKCTMDEIRGSTTKPFGTPPQPPEPIEP